MTIRRAFEPSRQAEPSSSSGGLPKPKIEYPSEEPFEEHVAHTKSHSMACTALERSIEDACDEDVSVGGDQFIYYVEGDPTQCLAPDVFVKLENGLKNFDSWLTWEEGTPELAVEIVSTWDRMKLTWEEKLSRYQASGILEVVRFDPKREGNLRIWDRQDGKLVERTLKKNGPYECRALHLYWVMRKHPDYGWQLRLARDPKGKELLPTPSESVLELARQLVEERAARSLAEHEQRVAKCMQEEAEKRRQEAEKRQQEAEQKLRDEAQARSFAEQKLRDAEAKLAALLADAERRGGTPQSPTGSARDDA